MLHPYVSEIDPCSSIELGGTFNCDIKLHLYLIINYCNFGILETG